MARIAFALDPAGEDRLLADAIEHGHEIVARGLGWRELVARLDEVGAEAVVVGAGRRTFSAELLEACDARGIRVVALAADDRERAHAGALGLHEVLEGGATWAEIEGCLAGAVPASVRQAGGPAATAGEILAVWGPAGAPGRTTLAVAVAAELAATGRRVALVDADPYGGAIAALLGLLDEAPGFAAACRLAGAGALDRSELERLAQRCTAARASFEVFTGLVGPGRWPELAHDRVIAALEAIRGHVDHVVVDTGFSLEQDEELTSDQFAPRRNAATFAALEAADRVIAVGLADPVGLARLLRGHAELVERVDPAKIDVVVNRVRSGAIGIDAYAQVRQTLQRFAGIDGARLLPHDGRAADAAILRARALRDAAPRSALATAIRDYVHERLVPRVEPQRRGRATRRRRAEAASLRRRDAPPAHSAHYA
jgi:MinD-like ATPase involved in chromosome partitioning or flagellar assembly